MNNVIKIKIHRLTSSTTWVSFEPVEVSDDDRAQTAMLSNDDCTLLAKELIAAALELISIK